MQQRVEFRYDVFGNRVEKKVDSDGNGTWDTTQRYAYDGWKTGPQKSFVGNENWDVWGDLDGSNSLQTRYLRADIVDQVFARIDTSTPYWYLTDRLGTIRDVTDNSGVIKDTIAYDGFGNITSESDSTFGGRYKWTNREFDTEISLQYNRARYYDAKTGRWISQDPLGFGAGDSNLYRYARNQSAKWTDPSGLTIYVYAFEGAGAFLHLGKAPVNTVVRQAVEAGAKAANTDLVYRYHFWTGAAAAQAELFFDRAFNFKKGDKCVVLGYSYGGKTAAHFADLNWAAGVRWDLVFTIDPVNWLPGTKIQPGLPLIPAVAADLAKRWVNYFQKVDTNSLQLGLGLLLRPVTVPIRGQSIGGGVNNIELNAANFGEKAFHLDPANGTETAYPKGQVFGGTVKIAHVLIPYYHPLLDDLKNRIAAL